MACETQHCEHRIRELANLDDIEHEIVTKAAEIGHQKATNDNVKDHGVELFDAESLLNVTEVALDILPEALAWRAIAVFERHVQAGGHNGDNEAHHTGEHEAVVWLRSLGQDSSSDGAKEAAKRHARPGETVEFFCSAVGELASLHNHQRVNDDIREGDTEVR